VHSTVGPDVDDVDSMVAAARETAVSEGYGRPGDQIVIAAGMPFRQAGTTNLLHIADL